MTKPKRRVVKIKHFHLERIVDESGMSGLGRVAEGVVLPSKIAVMWWLVPPYSVQVYQNINALHFIHRHGKKQTTNLVWDTLPKRKK